MRSLWPLKFIEPLHSPLCFRTYYYPPSHKIVPFTHALANLQWSIKSTNQHVLGMWEESKAPKEDRVVAIEGWG